MFKRPATAAAGAWGGQPVVGRLFWESASASAERGEAGLDRSTRTASATVKVVSCSAVICSAYVYGIAVETGWCCYLTSSNSCFRLTFRFFVPLLETVAFLVTRLLPNSSPLDASY